MTARGTKIAIVTKGKCCRHAHATHPIRLIPGERQQRGEHAPQRHTHKHTWGKACTMQSDQSTLLPMVTTLILLLKRIRALGAMHARSGAGARPARCRHPPHAGILCPGVDVLFSLSGWRGDVRFVPGQIVEVERDSRGFPIYQCRRSDDGEDGDVLHERAHVNIRLLPQTSRASSPL